MTDTNKPENTPAPDTRQKNWGAVTPNKKPDDAGFSIQHEGDGYPVHPDQKGWTIGG